MALLGAGDDDRVGRGRGGAAVERADDQIDHRAAQPGHIVVARPGRVIRITRTGPARDVVEGARVLVQDVHDLLGAGAVERRQAARDPTLIGDRQDRRPLRRTGTGAVDRHPVERFAFVGIRVVHRVSAGRRSIVGDVGCRPRR